jgi:3-oxoacyl-[acyl-carrier protein] reductase
VRVLVTGASRGIGRAIALRLAREGGDVAVHYHRHRAEARAVLREVERGGGTGFAIGADLGTPAGARALATAAIRRWDHLDGLVLNAGVYPRARFAALNDRAWAECFEVNLFGPVRLVRALLPRLAAADSPSIVFVSSVLAVAGSSHGAHYAAAKGAVGALAASLARELAPHVRVNSVAPGSIDTAILAGDSPARRAERAKSILLGRLGAPAEVAAAVHFLLSPDASYLTGATIAVNGGLRVG